MNVESIALLDILRKAHFYIDNKNFVAASSLLSLIQEKFPEQADCLHAMGVVALELGDSKAADELFIRAISSLIDNGIETVAKKVLALFLANQGRAKHQTGDLVGAMISWLQSLSIDENSTVREWYKDLDLVTRQIGKDVERRISQYESGVDVNTDINNGRYQSQLKKNQAPKIRLPIKKTKSRRPNKVVAEKIQRLVEIGGIETAREVAPICAQLLKEMPDCADVYHWMGVSLLYQRRHEEALDWVKKAVELEPWHPFFQNTKGVILRRIGTPESAAECFREVLRLKPDYAEVHQNIGNIYRDEKKLREAEAWYRRALELKPDYPECFNNLGILKKEQKAFDEAIWFFEKAASMRATYPNPYLNLGVLYEEKKSRAKAAECYRKALKINPQIHEIRLSLLHNQMYFCDWDGLDEGITIVKQLVEDSYPGELMPFNFLSLPGTTASEQRKCGELFVAVRFAQFIRQAKEMGFSHERKRKNKLRIGYLSADFNAHAVAWSIVGVLETHNSDLFEVYAFSHGLDDGSEVRRRIKSCTNFINIDQLDHLSSARIIHKNEIDILIDLTAYTSHGRSEILALRPAPIQVNYLGFPSTMAASFVDYLIGDPVITPIKHAEHFSEKLALLPSCYFPFDNKRIVNGGTTRNEEGLPEDSFIFCSFNQPYKVNPMIWNVWCNILKQIPDSVLWLHAFDEETKQRLWSSIESLGIARSRLIFAKMKAKLEDHVGRIGLADLALDTVPYNGHTTTFETLLAGVPVVTALGETFASRVASSILTAANLPELVTSNLAEYQQLAISLAKDTDRLKVIREKLQIIKTSSQLFNTQKFTADLESIYLQMYENYVSGKNPEHIVIH
jgi:protein O-GlcNAc transferase